MSVEVRYQGNLGNRLFQYAIGRILAENLKYKLIAGPIEGFDITLDSVAGTSIEFPKVVFEANNLDLVGLYSGKYSGMRVVLDGYFQVYDYFVDHIETIRAWYDLSHIKPLFIPGPDDLVINWRLGDFLIPNRIWRSLPPTLLDRIILKQKWRYIYLVTDSPDHEVAIELMDRYNNLKIFHGSPLEDMRTLQLSHTLLISTSTFSWWAALLSNAEKVYFPKVYNWGSLAVYFPGEKIPAEKLFPHDRSNFIIYPVSIIERSVRNIVHLCMLNAYHKKLYYTHIKLLLHKRTPNTLLRFRRRIIEFYLKIMERL
jgi:hypothetical protein